MFVTPVKQMVNTFSFNLNLMSEHRVELTGEYQLILIQYF